MCDIQEVDSLRLDYNVAITSIYGLGFSRIKMLKIDHHSILTLAGIIPGSTVAVINIVTVTKTSSITLTISGPQL